MAHTAFQPPKRQDICETREGPHPPSPVQEGRGSKAPLVLLERAYVRPLSQRTPLAVPELFRGGRSQDHPIGASGPPERSHPAVRQRGDGAVQEHLHRRRDAALAARHLVAEVRPRRGQAQRPGQRRLHRPPPHLLRDARQLLLRRLLQGRGDRAGVEAGHRRPRPAQGAADGHRLCRGRRRRGAVAQDRRPARGADRPHSDIGQLLDHGRQRSVRALFGDLLRPRTFRGRRAARLPRRGRRPLRRDLEPRLHAVRAGGGRHRARPSTSVDRHRHGPGALLHGAAGRHQHLRDRSLPHPDRRQRRGAQVQGGGRGARQPPGDRRPPALRLLPHRRRDQPLQRGAGLCAAADHAAGHAPRLPARRERAGDAYPGAHPHRARWARPIPSCAAPSR